MNPGWCQSHWEVQLQTNFECTYPLSELWRSRGLAWYGILFEVVLKVNEYIKFIPNWPCKVFITIPQLFDVGTLKKSLHIINTTNYDHIGRYHNNGLSLFYLMKLRPAPSPPTPRYKIQHSVAWQFYYMSDISGDRKTLSTTIAL